MAIAVRFGPRLGEEILSLELAIRSAAAGGPASVSALCGELPQRIRQLIQNSLVSAARAPAAIALPERLEPEPTGAGVEPALVGPGAARTGRPVGTEDSAIPALTALRVAHGWPVQRIAEKARAAGAPISRSTVAALERGELAPRPRHVRAIAAAFGLATARAAELLGARPLRSSQPTDKDWHP